ncbi:YciI family protein [Devosia sp. A8/3-2]|nr:YciI family protein [Devosia sp. A8/3-2]
MRYMLLIHQNEAELAKAAPEAWQAPAADYAAFTEALVKAGGSPGERLQPTSAATSVRIRDGKTDVLDGPYSDTKEQFAGYFTIDVPDLDQAIAWAARCPSAKFGVIEVRPIRVQTGAKA